MPAWRLLPSDVRLTGHVRWLIHSPRRGIIKFDAGLGRPHNARPSHDIRSLSDFKRNTTDLLDRLRTTGHPLVLTINGKAELVVQDAEAYQALLDRVEAIEGIEIYGGRMDARQMAQIGQDGD